MDSHAKLGAVEFALLCTVKFAILESLQLNLHFLNLHYFVQLILQTWLAVELILWSEAPRWCAGDAHLSTNERKVQRTWSESSAGQKCKGSEQEVVSTEQHPQTKSTLASLFDDRWKVFSSEHYLLLIWTEVDIVGSIYLLSLFLIVQETTQEEVVVNPTTPSDQAHPCLFLWWTTCRPSGWGWMLFAAFVFYLFSWLLVDLILLKKYVVPSTIEHCNTFILDTTQEEVVVKWCSVFEHQCEWSWLQIFIFVIVRISFEQQVAWYLCG